ncbi:MAG: hypothetical protein IIB43_08630 [Candidatus Marinimicrobia bacterium]|nr:hypothetical protein [Candidatus Neomarinimicrobiota bacterium]
MKKPQHRTAAYARRLREEAFDLYCTGLSHPRVQAELAQRHGEAAPSRTSLRRWAQADRWQGRRNTIWQAIRVRQDADRTLSGDEYLEELHQLRRTVLEALQNLSFSTAEGALFALAALERVIGRQLEQLQINRLNATFKPLMGAQIDQLAALLGTPPQRTTRQETHQGESPREGSMPTDRDHDHIMSSS